MAVTVAEIEAILRLRDDMSPALNTAKQNIGLAGTSLGSLTGAMTAATAAGTLLAKGISAVGSGLLSAVQSSIQTNAQLETARLQFETLTGSAERANEIVQDLFDFAKATPFETTTLIEASRIMQTFGGNALNTKENLTLFGDAAAATAAPMEQVTMWVSRAFAAMQANEPIGEATARLMELGVITPQVKSELAALQAQGELSASGWDVLSASLGQFTGAMEAQAQTWEGLTSTFRDTVALTFAQMGEPIFEELKGLMSELNEWLASPEMAAWVDQFSAQIPDAAATAATGLRVAGESALEAAGFWAQTFQSTVAEFQFFKSAFESVADTMTTAFDTFMATIGASDIGVALQDVTDGMSDMRQSVIDAGSPLYELQEGFGVTATDAGAVNAVISEMTAQMASNAASVSVAAAASDDHAKKLQEEAEALDKAREAAMEAIGVTTAGMSGILDMGERNAFDVVHDVLFPPASMEAAKVGIDGLLDHLDTVPNRFEQAFEAAKQASMEPWRSFGDDLSGVIMDAITGGGDIGDSIGALIGGRIGESLQQAYSTTILSGAQSFFGDTLGSTIGSAISGFLPGVGNLLGAGFGAIWDGLTDAAHRKTNDMRDQWELAAGGFDVLAERAKQAGVTLDTYLSADKPEEFQAAVAELESAFAAFEERVTAFGTGLSQTLSEGTFLTRELIGEMEALAQSGSETFSVDAQAATFQFIGESARQIAEGFNEAAAGFEAMSGDLGLTNAQVRDLSTIGVGAFGALVEGGASFREALDAIGPGLETLRDAISTGIGGSGSALFDDLMRLGDLSDQFGPLLDAVSGVSDALTGLSNLRFLDASSLQSSVDLMRNAFDQMVSGGASAGDAMRLMAGDLQVAWEAQETLGIKVGGASGELLAQAQAAGVVGPQFKSAHDRMIESVDALVARLTAMTNVMLGLPADAGLAASGVTGALGQIDATPAVHQVDRVAAALGPSVGVMKWSDAALGNLQTNLGTVNAGPAVGQVDRVAAALGPSVGVMKWSDQAFGSLRSNIGSVNVGPAVSQVDRLGSAMRTDLPSSANQGLSVVQTEFDSHLDVSGMRTQIGKIESALRTNLTDSARDGTRQLNYYIEISEGRVRLVEKASDDVSHEVGVELPASASRAESAFGSLKGSAVTDLRAIEEAIRKILFGSSPGGIEDIITLSSDASDAVRVFSREAENHLRRVEAAATAAAWGSSPTGIAAIITALERASDAVESFERSASSSLSSVEGQAAQIRFTGIIPELESRTLYRPSESTQSRFIYGGPGMVDPISGRPWEEVDAAWLVEYATRAGIDWGHLWREGIARLEALAIKQAPLKQYFKFRRGQIAAQNQIDYLRSLGVTDIPRELFSASGQQVPVMPGQFGGLTSALQTLRQVLEGATPEWALIEEGLIHGNPFRHFEAVLPRTASVQQALTATLQELIAVERGLLEQAEGPEQVIVIELDGEVLAETVVAGLPDRLRVRGLR